MSRSLHILVFLFVSVLIVLSSCNTKTEVSEEDDDILVTVGDSSLTVNEVLLKIPSGLTAEDSTAMFNSIVDEWISDLVLAEYAENNVVNMTHIDRMVDEYRKRLIVNEYLRSMSEGAKKNIPESGIKDYFDANKASMICEQPLVKGILIKISDNDEALGDLRKWTDKLDDNSIDNIEKAAMRKAMLYKYFNDVWIEWSAIADLIPYRFGNADDFLKSSKIFETTQKGYTYLLRISDYIPTGAEMPYEYARLQIADILRSSDMNSYIGNLIEDIYKDQIEKGNLKPGSYDPLLHGKKQMPREKNKN